MFLRPKSTFSTVSLGGSHVRRTNLWQIGSPATCQIWQWDHQIIAPFGTLVAMETKVECKIPRTCPEDDVNLKNMASPKSHILVRGNTYPHPVRSDQTLNSISSHPISAGIHGAPRARPMKGREGAEMGTACSSLSTARSFLSQTES